MYSGVVDKTKPKHPYNGIWKTEKVTKKSCIHIAKERLEDGMKDPLVFGSDKMMAKTLAKYSGKDVWLLPENHKEKGMVNPDAFFEGATLEMKHVRGDRRKVGLNACRALHQSENVFLYVEKEIPIDVCLRTISGTLKNIKEQALKNGNEFIGPNSNGKLLIFTNGMLYNYIWDDVL